MIQMFEAYIKTIVAFLIFSAFVEMVLPDNRFKKYINMILGFLMIVALLKPIGNIVSENFDYKDFTALIDKKEIELQNGTMYTEDYPPTTQNDIVIEIFKDELNESIKNDAEQFNISVKEVSATVIEDTEDDNYGIVTQISITAEIKKGDENHGFVEIEPVKVNTYDDTATEEESDESYKDLIRTIEGEISNIYSVPYENVHVNLLKS